MPSSADEFNLDLKLVSVTIEDNGHIRCDYENVADPRAKYHHWINIADQTEVVTKAIISMMNDDLKAQEETYRNRHE